MRDYNNEKTRQAMEEMNSEERERNILIITGMIIVLVTVIAGCIMLMEEWVK